MYVRKDHEDYHCLIGARGRIYTSEKWVTITPVNGLSPDQHQAITLARDD